VRGVQESRLPALDKGHDGQAVHKGAQECLAPNGQREAHESGADNLGFPRVPPPRAPSPPPPLRIRSSSCMVILNWMEYPTGWSREMALSASSSAVQPALALLCGAPIHGAASAAAASGERGGVSSASQSKSCVQLSGAVR